MTEVKSLSLECGVQAKVRPPVDYMKRDSQHMEHMYLACIELEWLTAKTLVYIVA